MKTNNDNNKSKIEITSIREALLLITSSKNAKPTKGKLVAWEVATRNLLIEQIVAATMYYIEDDDSEFMPSTGQFIRKAKRITSEKIIEKRMLQEMQENNRYIEDKPAGKEKIKELSRNLADSMSKKKAGSLEKPSIILYEFLSETGKTVRFEAIGKHEFQFFMDQVYKAFGKTLHKVIHQNANWEIVKPPENTKGKYYSTYRKVNQPSPNSEVLTVGYV